MTDSQSQCPFNPSRTCPHLLFEQDPMWCHLCLTIQVIEATPRRDDDADQPLPEHPELVPQLAPEP